MSLSRKGLLLLFVVAIGCAAAELPNDYQHITRDRAQNALKSITRVRTPMGSGSGIIVFSDIVGETTASTTYVLTVSHVVKAFDIVLVDRFKRTKLTCTGFDTNIAEVVMNDPVQDVALLRIDNLHVDNIAQIVSETDLTDTSIMDPVYAIGCQLGLEPIFTEGRLIDYAPGSCRVTAPSIVGSSGGGVFLTNGMCLGMVQGIGVARTGHTTTTLVPHIVSVISAARITKWLDESPYQFIVKRAQSCDSIK